MDLRQTPATEPVSDAQRNEWDKIYKSFIIEQIAQLKEKLAECHARLGISPSEGIQSGRLFGGRRKKHHKTGKKSRKHRKTAHRRK